MTNFDVTIAILIALAPSLLLFVYFAKKRAMWLAFVLGGLGWLAALLLRLLPLQIPPSVYGPVVISNITYLAYSTFLAGVFEEGTRYVLFRKIKRIRVDWRHVLCFGLGWGFGEALLLYAAAIVSAVYLSRLQLTFLDMLPGAIERNLTVALHIGWTFIVFKALAERKFVFVAIALHAAIDFIAVTAFQIFGLGMWYVEGMIFVMALATVAYAYKLLRRWGAQFTMNECG